MKAERLGENQKQTIIHGLNIAVQAFKKDAETCRQVGKDHPEEPNVVAEMGRMAKQFERQVEETSAIIETIEEGDLAVVPILGEEW